MNFPKKKLNKKIKTKVFKAKLSRLEQIYWVEDCAHLMNLNMFDASALCLSSGLFWNKQPQDLGNHFEYRFTRETERISCHLFS